MATDWSRIQTGLDDRLVVATDWSQIQTSLDNRLVPEVDWLGK